MRKLPTIMAIWCGAWTLLMVNEVYALMIGNAWDLSKSFGGYLNLLLLHTGGWFFYYLVLSIVAATITGYCCHWATKGA